MEQTKTVKTSCVEQDRQLKRVAAGYKTATRLLRKRIGELKIELLTLKPKDPARAELTERLTILNSMLQTTSEIGREAEHYYERGWWRSGIYTLNPRKRG